MSAFSILNQGGTAWQNCFFFVGLQVDSNLRFMILMDGVHPEMDTCIIVEYKGAFLSLQAMENEACRG